MWRLTRADFEMVADPTSQLNEVFPDVLLLPSLRSPRATLRDHRDVAVRRPGRRRVRLLAVAVAGAPPRAMDDTDVSADLVSVGGVSGGESISSARRRADLATYAAKPAQAGTRLSSRGSARAVVVSAVSDDAALASVRRRPHRRGSAGTRNPRAVLAMVALFLTQSIRPGRPPRRRGSRTMCRWICEVTVRSFNDNQQGRER